MSQMQGKVADECLSQSCSRSELTRNKSSSSVRIDVISTHVAVRAIPTYISWIILPIKTREYGKNEVVDEDGEHRIRFNKMKKRGRRERRKSKK